MLLKAFKIYKKHFLLFCLLWMSCQGYAKAIPDSVKQFDLKEFYEVILNNHPVVSQARLLDDVAKQEIRIARGAFDPRIESYYGRKDFDGENYYETWNNALRVPLWFNTDIRLGYEQNDGKFLNPQSKVPDAGLLYGGINIPIGQGLVIDARRATLRQAQELEGMLQADKIKAINRVLLNATKDYWDWYFAYHQLQLLNNAQKLAEERYQGIVDGVVAGDLAPIDSVEALLILQNRQVELQQAKVTFQNSTIVLSNYLWNSDETPLELTSKVVPVDHTSLVKMDNTDLEVLVEMAQTKHPDLIRIDHEIRQIEIERRLNKDMLKPAVGLTYNFLNQPTGRNPSDYINAPLLGQMSQNYTVGVSFSFPLFLRKERGKLQKTNIRLMQSNYERDIRNREIVNTINAEYNEMQNAYDLIDMQEKMVKNHQTLLNGELDKFEAGESSVFLVNTRENNLIEAQRKLISLQSRFEKSKATLLWAAGIENLSGF